MTRKVFMSERIENHVRKMKALFCHQLQDGIVVHFVYPSGVSAAFPDSGRGETERLKIPEYRGFLKEVPGLIEESDRYADDFCPLLGVRGGAIYGGYFGAEVLITGASIWSAPIPDLYENLVRLPGGPDNLWRKWETDAMAWLRGRLPNGIALKNGCSYGPVDVAEALRGTGIYMDFYERPDALRKLLGICADFLVDHYGRCRVLATQVDGGFFSWQGFWVPMDCCSITDDAATNYSPDFFEEFSVPAIRSVVDRLGGRFEMHLEGSAVHIMDILARMNGLLILQYTNNPKRPRGIAMVDTLRSKLGNIPAKILLSNTEFLDAMKQRLLPGNWIYDVGFDVESDDYVRSAQEAQEIMRKAAEYRPRF